MIRRWKRHEVPEDRRQAMIDETGAFLTWALKHDKQIPQIPKRAVSEGGFEDKLKRKGARAAVNHWWSRAVDLVGKVSDW